MKPFDAKSKCKKCGYATASTTYDGIMGLLTRCCARCSYTWPEVPLDQAPVPATPVRGVA